VGTRSTNPLPQPRPRGQETCVWFECRCYSARASQPQLGRYLGHLPRTKSQPSGRSHRMADVAIGSHANETVRLRPLDPPTINRFMGSGRRLPAVLHALAPPGSAGIPADTRNASRRALAGKDAGAPVTGTVQGKTACAAGGV
jgi:hypothetical protein